MKPGGLSLLWALWFVTSQGLAAPVALPTTEELGLYYTLGGTHAVPPAPGETLRIQLLPDIQAGATYSCGKFDYRFQMEQILQRLEDQLVTLKSLPAQFLLALPGGLFCRAFPGACQLMQYYTARAGEAFKLALSSCQDMEQMVADRGPASPWIQIAKSLEWGRQAEEKGNVLDAKEEVEEAGERGVVWVGGRRAGGLDQDLIRPIYDSGQVGWCLLNGEPIDCSQTNRTTEIAALFETPEGIGEWLVDVVGEQAVSTAGGTSSPTITGHGLLPLIEVERARIETILQQMVQTDPIELDHRQMADISSRHLLMHREVIDGLQGKPDSFWRVQRLASELATARIVEKAFVARAALQAGRQEPNIAALKPAREVLGGALGELNRQIDFVLNEVRASHRLAADTIRSFIEYETLTDALKPVRLQPADDTGSSLIDGGFPIEESE